MKEQKENKVIEKKPLFRLHKSPAIMASGVSTKKPKESKTSWLSSDSDELCDRINLLKQKKKHETILKISMKKLLLETMSY